MERIQLIGSGLAAALFVAAPLSAGADSAGAPQGGVSSLSDLNAGTANWGYIAPHALPAAPAAGGLTDVAKVTPAPGRQAAPAAADERRIDDYLSIAPPAPPPTVEGPLWYMPQGR